MLERDTIMEFLMHKKHQSGWLIQDTSTFSSDINDKLTLIAKNYEVYPNQDGETMQGAEVKKAELMSTPIENVSININSKNDMWNDIWENIDVKLEEFLAEIQDQRHMVDNTIKNMKSGFKYLNLFCVKDTVPTLEFYKDVQKKMKVMPFDYLRAKKWRGKDISWIMNNLPKSDYQTIKPTTINKHINFHKQFFEWLEYNDSKYTTDMKKLKTLWEDDTIVKEEYQPEDLNLIFNSDISQDLKEFCLVALFTGLRISEISNLKKVNINTDINFIEVFDGKTKNAIRAIPIHNKIQKILEKRIKSRFEFLFFEGNSSANSKKLNRYLNKIITDKSKSFHSFRKNYSQFDLRRTIQVF
ncbi:tyrosine-type recombinase/integrase [Sulfurimonas sp.]|jgi:site-specific recombinase XerD|uniref:tyrosine-type recombinase/integrase n=1 Tax=Sulfurimonas sp. TaxID=2022749 RepID=UPI0025CEFE7D|nr:tyrosine-type recombinase/integrase [Sulfurimonas sp.]MBT5934127.1 tyrosine-type recombinase/integrase [Sulfurimonas sp.]